LLSLLNAADLKQDVEVTGSLAVDYENPEVGFPPPAPLIELERMAIEQRSDLAAVMAEGRRADSQSRLQRAIRSPNITVGGGYKRNGPDNSLIFGITIPLKIFNPNEGGVLRADAERNRAANMTALVRKRIELDVQKAYNAVEINRERVLYIKNQHLNKAEDTSRVTSTAYRLGGATLIDYLDAQRSFRDTVRIYNRALYDERISLYELAAAVGMGGK
jgi:cobalt-zinc-cadmium efflux system outer membrane protein